MIKILKQIVLVTILLGVIVCVYAQQESNVVSSPKQEKTVNNLDSIIQVYALSNVYFDFGSKTIRTDDIKKLEQIALLLQNNSELKLEIIGHIDNQEVKSLSVARAQEVFEWFVNQGIDKRLIVYKSMGSVYPILSNNNPEHRQINRRVEFRIFQ